MMGHFLYRPGVFLLPKWVILGRNNLQSGPYLPHFPWGQKIPATRTSSQSSSQVPIQVAAQVESALQEFAKA